MSQERFEEAAALMPRLLKVLHFSLDGSLLHIVLWRMLANMSIVIGVMQLFQDTLLRLWHFGYD